MLTIKQSDKSFYIGDSEKEPLAEMTFVCAGDNIIIIDHTSVSDELRGQNIGKQLLQRLVEFAREENKKVVPLCPFAKKEMIKNKEEYEEILVE
ncbi:MAG: GNAT family N-acetyltransferase [Acidaminococcaceae bacterium]